MKIRQYLVTFPRNPEYNAVWTLELTKSGVFSYGNGTCVVVKREEKTEGVIDTRYEKEILQNFTAWCDEYMRSKFDQDLSPEIELVFSAVTV